MVHWLLHMETEESLYSLFKKDLTLIHLGSLKLMKRKSAVALLIAHHDFWIFNNLWPHRLRDAHVLTCFLISLLVYAFCYCFFFCDVYLLSSFLYLLASCVCLWFIPIFEDWKRAVCSPRQHKPTNTFNCACALAPLIAEFPHAHTR